MNDNVVPLFGHILHDEPAEQYLDTVKNNNLEQVLIIGFDEDGVLFVGGNTSNFERLVYMMYRANQHIASINSVLNMADDGDI